MTIDVHFNCATVGDLHLEMHALLIGHTNRPNIGAVAGTGESGGAGVGTQTDKPMTAAQRKAAEKAAKEAAEKSYAEKGATLAGISTGEERTDPQDTKDEAADTKASTPEPYKFNHDSVRALLGGYVQAYGMAAAQEDGAKMIEIAKISDLKDDQAVFAKAVLAIAQGIEKNPYKREIAGDGITAEKLAELKPIVTAAMAVK